MTSHIHVDESVWVLLLVCAPLLMLLIVLIALLARAGRRTARFADVSVTISRISRDEGYIEYVAGGKQAQFPASIGRGRGFFRPLIEVVIPAELAQEVLRKVVSDVGLGLNSLRYEYRIY